MIGKKPLRSTGLLDCGSLLSSKKKRPRQASVEDRRKRIGFEGSAEESDSFVEAALPERITGPINHAPRIDSRELRMREGMSGCGKIAVMMKVNPAQGGI